MPTDLMDKEKEPAMKKTISPVLYLIFSAAVLLLSGCSRHYTQDEAEKWFRENVVDAPIDISVDYTEEKGADGYTDHVSDLLI